MTRRLLLLPLLLAAPMAQAQATPEGAARLTETLQTYFGATPGVVNVTAEGATYAVTLDAGPLFAKIPAEAQATVSLSPMRLTLADNGDGTWAVMQDQPISFAVKVGNELDMTVDVTNVACSGVWDEALQAMPSNDCTLTGLSLNQTVVDPVSGPMSSQYAIESGEYTTTAVANPAGGVDGTTAGTFRGLVQTMALPMDPSAPPLPLTIRTEEYVIEGTSTGVRPAAFLQAMAWAVAHPDETSREAGKADLSAILKAGMPFFEHIDATTTLSGMSIESPVGPIGLDSVTFDVEVGGAVAEGLFREAIAIRGITPPPGILPPYAEALMPTDAAIDISVTRFDAASAITLLIGLLDLPAGAEPPAGFDGTMLQALMPEGVVDVTLAPGEAGNADWRLTYEGSITAGPVAPPTGKGLVTATGLEAVFAALDQAPPEVKDQMLPVLGMAQGLGRPGADGTLTWEIDASTPGSLLVNGMDLMGLQ
jgi:hypothetical protein